jgi:hypothetical protein
MFYKQIIMYNLPMEHISRSEAKSRGLKHFFTGRPCKHGHVSRYFVSSHLCMECDRLKRIETADARNSKKRAKRAQPEEKGKIAAARKLHYEANREAISARRSAAYEKNQDAMREKVRKWHAENRGKANAVYAARQMRKRNATPPWADLDVIASIYVEAKALGWHVDHIIPITNKLVCGLHIPANLRPLDPTENVRKKNKFNPLDHEWTADNRRGCPTFDDWLATRDKYI